MHCRVLNRIRIMATRHVLYCSMATRHVLYYVTWQQAWERDGKGGGDTGGKGEGKRNPLGMKPVVSPGDMEWKPEPGPEDD